MTLIYSQTRSASGKPNGWTITLDGKVFKAKTLRRLRMMVHRELIATGPYVIVDHTF